MGQLHKTITRMQEALHEQQQAPMDAPLQNQATIVYIASLSLGLLLAAPLRNLTRTLNGTKGSRQRETHRDGYACINPGLGVVLGGLGHCERTLCSEQSK